MKDQCLLLRDYYATPEMRTVWTEENMVQKWLDVEAAIAWAQGELKMIPKWASRAIVRGCDAKKVTPLLVFREFEKARHWIVSLVHAFAKAAGPEGEYFHLGTTTQDILDGGLTLQIRESYVLLLKELRELESILVRLARRHRATVMAGRTEGQQASPVTYGQKIAILCSEIRDHIERLKECSKRLFYANVSSGTGAQSTFVYLSDLQTTRRMETLVARRLSLHVPYMSMHHRTDRFAELLNILALVNSTLGEAGMDLRDLQRTEVAEVAEPWDIEHQHSSSTFPHKRNPETSEWQEGLAKLSRTNALAMMDVQQQHERDASRYAVEFSRIAESFGLASSAIAAAKRIYGGLIVDKKAMRRNLELQRELTMTEAVMLRLYQKTKRKVEAHTICHDAAQLAREEGRSLKECLLADPVARKHLTAEEIDEVTKPESYIGTCPQQVDRALARIARLRRTDGRYLRMGKKR